MAELNEVYKCAVCGNMVEVVHPAMGGGLVCCGQPMRLLKENSVDASKEKHVPVIEKSPMGVRVRVGSVPHPMDKEHYIEFIEVLTSTGKSCKRFLKPGEKPEAEFGSPPEQVVAARAYCNLHSLWKS